MNVKRFVLLLIMLLLAAVILVPAAVAQDPPIPVAGEVDSFSPYWAQTPDALTCNDMSPNRYVYCYYTNFYCDSYSYWVYYPDRGWVEELHMYWLAK